MAERIMVPYVESLFVAKAEGHTGPAWAWMNHGNGEREVLTICNCGIIAGIGRHTISANGDVNASYYCADRQHACGWHVFITLQDYAQHGGVARGPIE